MLIIAPDKWKKIHTLLEENTQEIKVSKYNQKGIFTIPFAQVPGQEKIFIIKNLFTDPCSGNQNTLQER